MFERLNNAAYFMSMILASNRAWRQRQSAKPQMIVFGWEVWSMDGKAYLFKNGKCKRADWFEFCYAARKWIGMKRFV